MHGSQLSIQVVRSQRARTLLLTGELDITNIDQLLEAAVAGDDPLVIDTTGLDFIDSAGVGALIGIRERVGASHFRLILGERTLRILKVAGLAPDFSPTDASGTVNEQSPSTDGGSSPRFPA